MSTLYTLPELPYDYSALEPHISGKIMELHHSKHHQAYVTGANTALEQLATARSAGDLANVNKLEKDLALTSAGTSTTPSSGRTSRPRAAALRRASSRPRSSTHSDRSMRSGRTSPRPRSVCRDRAGPCSPGTAWAPAP